MAADSFEKPHDARNEHFATTQWSVVLAAGNLEKPGSRDALAQLCEAYWYPLYAYVRRRVDNVHEAQDLTQAFFSKLLEQRMIASAEPDRGRFRAFLLAALKNFLINEWNKNLAAKRGGGKAELSLDFDSGESRYRIEPWHNLTPERLYERRWVLTVLDQVLECLRVELAEAGKPRYFEQFKATLTGEATSEDYDRAAVALGISPAAAKQAAYRLRKRYRELLRAEVARTVDREEDVDQEIERLLSGLE
jgi:RNA polymerase sigma factor (sigma-70 family)